jgi:S1-C subfamily serine protease
MIGDIMTRKFLMVAILIVFTIGLSSCVKEMTYDDLLLEYQQDIEARQEVYQSYIEFYDELSTTTRQSVVKVTKNVTLSTSTSIGSGFIFYEDLDAYYVLTNNHVIYNDTIYTATLTITDYLGVDHIATLLANDESYDLAVLSFPKSNLDVDPLVFSETELVFTDTVIVMGYPNGQINSMTIGELIDIDEIDISNHTDGMGVFFDVLIMDVPVETGSSGSVVMNEDFEIVGVVYAGNFIDSGETSEFSFAIPAYKVFEFLDLNDITYEDEVTS